jgi:hypothetical protein
MAALHDQDGAIPACRDCGNLLPSARILEARRATVDLVKEFCKSRLVPVSTGGVGRTGCDTLSRDGTVP